MPKFLSKRSITSDCKHETQMKLEVAGMSRAVCELCGKISVGYVADHFQVEQAQEVEDAIRAFGKTSPES